MKREREKRTILYILQANDVICSAPFSVYLLENGSVATMVKMISKKRPREIKEKNMTIAV